MQDGEIIELYFLRSESAIAETARKYGAYLNQVAYNILRSKEDTEEIVQDTYMAAWGKIPPERPRILRHFLSRITRNMSFDRLDYLTAKCRNSNMVEMLSELEDCIPDPRRDLESIMEAKLIGRTINHFLSTLDELDCSIFLCRYYYCMTIGEIGEKHRLSERNVKYRLTCLRRKLRQALDKEGIAV